MIIDCHAHIAPPSLMAAIEKEAASFPSLRLVPDPAGGFGLCGIPEKLIEALLRADTRDLVIAANTAGTLLGGLLALHLAGVDALCDVRRLAGDQILDEHLVGVEHVVVVDVADVANGSPHDLLIVELRGGRDFTGDHHLIGLNESLARDAAGAVLSQASVEDAVGNQVGNLVGMPLANGFR